MSGSRWLAVLIGLVIVLSIIGLLAYGRGTKHHRGDEIGTHGTPPPAHSG